MQLEKLHVELSGNVAQLRTALAQADKALAQTQVTAQRMQAGVAGVQKGAAAAVPSIVAMTTATRATKVPLGELRSMLATVASNAAGVPGVIGRLSASLSSLAYGSVATAGVLGGLAAIAAAVNFLGREARETRERMAELFKMDPAGRQSFLRDVQALEDAFAMRAEAQREMASLPATVAGGRIIGGNRTVGAIREQIANPRIAELEGNVKRFSNLIDDLGKKYTKQGEATTTLTAAVTAAGQAFDSLEAARALNAVADVNKMMAAAMRSMDASGRRLIISINPSDRAAFARILSPEALQRRGQGIGRIATTLTAQSAAPTGNTGPSRTDRAFQALGQVGDAFKGILAVLNPWQMILGAIEHALGDFLASVTPIVQLLATALMPILEALFPVFKLVAIAATYVGQVMFNIAGAIMKAIGGLLEAVGKAINWLLPGNPANGMVKLGKGMTALGDGFWTAAGDLGVARDAIKGLEWQAGKTADAIAGMTSGLPDWFRLDAYRYQAAGGGGMARAGGAQQGTTVHIQTVQFSPAPGAGGDESYDAFMRVLQRKWSAGTTTPLDVRFAPAGAV